MLIWDKHKTNILQSTTFCICLRIHSLQLFCQKQNTNSSRAEKSSTLRKNEWSLSVTEHNMSNFKNFLTMQINSNSRKYIILDYKNSAFISTWQISFIRCPLICAE